MNNRHLQLQHNQLLLLEREDYQDKGNCDDVDDDDGDDDDDMMMMMAILIPIIKVGMHKPMHVESQQLIAKVLPLLIRIEHLIVLIFSKIDHLTIWKFDVFENLTFWCIRKSYAFENLIFW